jgi:UDPglucose 6-dehydrogenase
MQATEQAHALLIVTEWKTFHHPDFAALKTHMQRPLILDGRNLYDPQLLENMGFAYQGIGRRNGLALHMLDEECSNQIMPLETVA